MGGIFTLSDQIIFSTKIVKINIASFTFFAGEILFALEFKSFDEGGQWPLRTINPEDSVISLA